MGSSGSKEGQRGPSQHVESVFRDTEPRVVLGNQSSYRISYWVVEEDRNHKRSKANRKRLVGSMGLHLNGGNPGESAPLADVNGATAETIDMEEDDVPYFLTRDHRMEPEGGTQATKIPFPVDCQEMRVCAFFETGDQWRLFQDKVYSIGLFKQVFTFTALDNHITPRLNGPASR